MPSNFNRSPTAAIPHSALKIWTVFQPREIVYNSLTNNLGTLTGLASPRHLHVTLQEQHSPGRHLGRHGSDTVALGNLLASGS